MKTLIRLLVVCSFALLPLQNTQAKKHIHFNKFFSIGLNLGNNTSYNGSIYLYGPTNISSYFGPGGSSYGPLTAGTYYVNMYISAPGTHTFTFNGQSVTTSEGHATFSNVSITSTVFAFVN